MGKRPRGRATSTPSSLPRGAGIASLSVAAGIAIIAAVWQCRAALSVLLGLATPAQRLAALINDGRPVNVTAVMTEAELEMALGTLSSTPGGWRERVGSFIELLDMSPGPERRAEAEAARLPESHFDVPLVVIREHGGLAARLAPHLTEQELLGVFGELPVRPSRCASLAINWGPAPRADGGAWNPELMPFSPCRNCSLPLSAFVERTMRSVPFGLATPAADELNVMLQTHGLTPHALPFLADAVAKRRHFEPPPLQPYYQGCHNPPAIGAAGSLRGLAFHGHAATSNEALVGRKLFALLPPRGLVSRGVDLLCGWPPWRPQQHEAVGQPQYDEALASFFGGAAGGGGAATLGGGEGLRSCRDQSVTPLRWLATELPRLPLEHRPLLTLIRPGEVLWIPDGWLHMTVNLDDALWLYAPSCQAGTTAREELARRRAAARRVCERTGRFCDGYCHSHCSQCEGRTTRCDPS